jgi:hypothetical protein
MHIVDIEIEVDGIDDPVWLNLEMERVDIGIGDYECHGVSGIDIQMVWQMSSYSYGKSSYSNEENELIADYIDENIDEIEVKGAERLNEFL